VADAAIQRSMEMSASEQIDVRIEELGDWRGEMLAHIRDRGDGGRSRHRRRVEVEGSSGHSRSRRRIASATAAPRSDTPSFS
jgi:hypothetical protein